MVWLDPLLQLGVDVPAEGSAHGQPVFLVGEDLLEGLDRELDLVRRAHTYEIEAGVGLFQSASSNLRKMPFKDPEKRKAAQRKANEKFRKKHPKRMAKAKAAWYQKNRKSALARVAKWKRDNPEGAFNAHLLRKYGISRGQYDALLKWQNGVCKICQGPPTGKTKRGAAVRLDVDHDHVTGHVRGLLCHPCNMMLGSARDRVEVLRAAILYLEQARGRH